MTSRHGLVESRVRGNAHARFGGRAGETDQWKRWHCVPARPYSVREADRVRHEFRHRAHPDYGGARVYAHVFDDDSGPRLGQLAVDGRKVPLSDLDTVDEP